MKNSTPGLDKAAAVKIPKHAEALLSQVGHLAAAKDTRVYAVGGCVRDWSLGIKQTSDLDVTVEGDGISLAKIIAEAVEGKMIVHEPFGTATIQHGPIRLDVASCRRESYVRPAVYPKVSPGSIYEDLFRRDFTINAMALSLNPSCFALLVDPYRGRKDLAGKVLRILHQRSFLDDPSRILRGIRFAKRFGLRWESETLKAAQAAVAQGALGWLNAGRLAKELEHMHDEPNPKACLEGLAAFLN